MRKRERAEWGKEKKTEEWKEESKNRNRRKNV